MRVKEALNYLCQYIPERNPESSENHEFAMVCFVIVEQIPYSNPKPMLKLVKLLEEMAG